MIKIDAPKIKEVEKQLGEFKKQAPSVIARALNRAVENTRTNAVRKTTEQYGIKAKDVRATISIVKANKNTLGAVVKSKGPMLPLSKFKVNPSNPRPKNPPKVLKVAVKKNGLKEILGAFVADVNGNKVFRREGKSRLPIKQLFAPAVPIMIGNANVLDYIESEALKVFDKRLDHEINRALGSGKK